MHLPSKVNLRTQGTDKGDGGHCNSNGTSEHELPKPSMLIHTLSFVLLHAAENNCSLVLACNCQRDRWCLINGMWNSLLCQARAKQVFCSVHGCAYAWVCVCMGVWLCVFVYGCVSVRGCVWLCVYVCGCVGCCGQCVSVCGCMGLWACSTSMHYFVQGGTKG